MVENNFNISIVPMRSRGGPLVSNKYGNTTLRHWPNQTYVLEGGCQIKSSASWLEIFLEIIHQFHTSILLSNQNFNQSANVNSKPRKRYVFWIYVMLLQSSDTFLKKFVSIFHIYYLFLAFIAKTIYWYRTKYFDIS
jgi:hypothetical protein